MTTSNIPSSSLEADTYRSSTTGARVWRRELLSRRRDEFADLPDGIRSVYVARVARALAGLMLTLGGALIVALSASPELAAWLESMAPGPRPAVTTSLLGIAWGLGALMYLGGWALAENRFTRAMLRAVKPTEDLHHDVQRLANVSPGTIAVGMTRAWATASATLPVLAVATLLPATLIYLAMAVAAGGFVELSAYESMLASGSHWLAASAGLGLFAALLIRNLGAASRAALCARRQVFWAGFTLGSIGVAAGFLTSSGVALAGGGALAIVSAFGAWAAGRIRKERTITDSDDQDRGADASLASTLRKLRTLAADARTSVRERGAVGSLGHGLRAARARLAIGRRLLALIKAPLSWSLGTYATLGTAALIVAFTGWLGAGALAQESTDNSQSAASLVSPSAQTPDTLIPQPNINPDHNPDNNGANVSASPILYTAPPAGPGMAGTLLVVDLRKGLYASTKLDIDLNYLPCGKIRTDAGWVTGTIERADGQLILSEDYAPGEPDALDITSASQRGPLELRDAEGIVFTPCMVARNLDMDALGDLIDAEHDEALGLR